MVVVENKDEKNSEVNFLLKINRELWNKFCETVPPYYTRNDVLIMLIQQRINDLEGKKNEKKKQGNL